ncbi:tail fiber domain-containing protein [Patiriisocius hiemis]|uniref:Tail fiber domain-containing protein n=1 Tax=Patiriisocius hiemis TaxID=3075604 RepID=A0ABU2YAR4_9FLAO|nr:tail fiber domain-containing protein [Constantimarinum sp. W242]MDT0555275.1 tail fiber domain-containing protein [Constantimarinum sp. W242]
MKIRLLITLFSLTSVLSYSQVGINTITPQAQLDIVAGNTPSEKDGILIPRLDEYPTGVGTNQDGMLVFITGNGTPTKGFYYWDNVGSAWVPVSGAGGSDADWNINGTSTSPTSINDNIYTLGNVKIGLNNTTETSRFYVNSDLATTNSGIRNIMSGNDDTVISYGIYNQGSITDALRHAGFHNVIGGTTDNTLYGIENRMVATGSGPKTAIVNEFDLSAPQGSKLGVLNRFEGGDSFVTGVRTEAPGAWSVTGTLTGVENDLSAGGNGVRYGVRNIINGLGTGAKYGSFNNIGSTAGGTHYGVYSDVRKANSYAGFFIGRMSLGTDGVLNRYLMPAADGTAGQVMTTDGSGNVTFQDATGGGTLDEAYDFGGAGAGKNIIADTGALRVDGEDGFLVTGTFGSGDAIDTEITGTGTRMFFNPRKAAFRAGYSEDARWDDANIGDYSFAVNRRSLASGFGSISLGYDSEATGDYSFVAGNNSAASGDNSFAFGLNSYTNNSNHAVVFGNVANARDDYSWAIGSGVNSYGVHSFAKGEGVTSYSYGETVFGFYNTSYTANSTTAFDAADRLFVLGNGVGATPSNALIIYKDGRMNINDAYTITNTDGTNGQVLTTDGGGNVTFQDATGGGTLDDAYDFGGAGTGRAITADNGAVDIQGAGGLRVEGNISAASNIFHDGDTNTFMSFTPDRVQFDAGGRNYIDIQHANEEIAFNEDSTESDFRVESGTNQNMFFVDGSRNRIGIGTNTPGTTLHIGTLNNFNTNIGVTGQDAIFIRGSETSGLNEVGGSIAFGGAHPARDNSRRAAIASMQTGIDEDNVGLAFYIHPGPVNTNPMEEAMRITHQKYLGINNISPSATLDVVGTMQFVDGNEANGYVLASDANGNATWTDPNTLNSGDFDWLTTAGASSTSISDNIYTNGSVSINTTTTFGDFNISHNEASDGTTDYLQYNSVSNSGNDNKIILYNTFGSSQAGDNTAIYNLMIGNGSGTYKGLHNYSYASVTGDIYGMYNVFSATGGGDHYGARNLLSGTGSGTKYGTYNIINSTAGGTHYGVYSSALKSNSFAGYFLGNLAIGTTTANTYILPASRGTNGQTMQTDGTGNVSWVDPVTSEWTDGGTFLYPTDGTTEDVVIGQNTSGTGRLSIDAGTKATSIKTNKVGSFAGLHFGVDNYVSNSGGGASIGVNNLIEGTGGSNLRYGTRTIINGSSTPSAVSHYGSYNQVNTTGTGFRYGTYNEIAATAGGTHYGTYNQVSTTSGWAGYFLGKNYVSESIGINNPNPDGRLDIIHNSTGSSSPHIMLTAQNANTGTRITFDNAVETTNNWVLFARSDNAANGGTFNIFSSEAGANVIRLDSDGKMGVMRNPVTNTLEVQGDASKTTAGSWLANSDRRLKKNIVSIKGETALDKIEKMRGVTYEWNDDKTGSNRPKGLQYGFIAQELMKVFPEKVTKDNLGFYQTAYGDYDPLFVEAIKELKKELQTLSEENEQLKKQLAKYESLEARLLALENGNKINPKETKVTAEK